jgi:hypothetical protein
MVKKIIVSLVGDQTIPNVLFIKEKGPADFFYFISTPKMEGKDVSQNIIRTLGIPADKYKIITVQEDSIMDMESKLNESVELQDDDDVWVNVTGGTKIMSLGVHNFFSRLGSAKICYLPIEKNNVIHIFPMRRNRTEELQARVNLKEYLTSYGVEFQGEGLEGTPMTKDFSVSQRIMSTFLDSNKRSEFTSISEFIRQKYRGREINPKRSEELKSAYDKCQNLKEYGMQFDTEQKVSREETKYITGDWFEEYVYWKVKHILDIPETHIHSGIQLKKEGSQNEYDVMFTRNNALYVIECKTNISDSLRDGEENFGKLLTDTLYKAATLKKDFGLWVNYYLFAINDFTNLSENHKLRANRLGVKLIGTESICDEASFRKIWNE